ncbi:hypothetical protein ACHAXS_013287 [Conticribra weissflogii]
MTAAHQPLPLLLLFLLLQTQTLALALATPSPSPSPLSPSPPRRRAYLITGANKGQGLALCRRILAEFDDTHVFLCSRDLERGLRAKASLLSSCPSSSSSSSSTSSSSSSSSSSPPSPLDESRIDVIALDVTSPDSVDAAASRVSSVLKSSRLRFAGIVSNAGILWGYPLRELLDVCAIGVKRVIEAFAPLLDQHANGDGDGRIVVVTSGLSPLMMSYARPSHREALLSDDCSWETTIQPLMNQCLDAYASAEDENDTDTDTALSSRIEAFESIGFPGGPFAEAAPDFHMYGLAKMFGDAVMKIAARDHPNWKVGSVDPGLVYTDLILKMPKYRGKERGETTAQSPEEGVEGAMRLLFGGEEVWGEHGEGRGKLFAMDKEKKGVVFSEIDRMPQKQ